MRLQPERLDAFDRVMTAMVLFFVLIALLGIAAIFILLLWKIAEAALWVLAGLVALGVLAWKLAPYVDDWL